VFWSSAPLFAVATSFGLLSQPVPQKATT